jgi:chromosome partitioning protein
MAVDRLTTTSTPFWEGNNDSGRAAMPTISFASSKGGAGKSTSAVLLATELAARNASITIVDADPNQPVTRWSKKPGLPEELTVVSNVTEETLIDVIDAAERKTQFVIVDLEGTASLMVAQAMSRADLVIIPTKGSELDAVEAVKVIKFIGRQERVYKKAIPFAVLFTQTNPAVRPRTLRSLEQDMLQQGIPLFGTALHERDAFRAIFSFGGTLSGLDPSAVSNVPAALTNARQFMAETVAMLTQRQTAAVQTTEVA